MPGRTSRWGFTSLNHSLSLDWLLEAFWSTRRNGAPGVDATEEGASLNPPAPGLTLPRVQARPDGQLFWVVSHGIRMTGMPAFGPSRSEQEIWQLVAALRRLPRLSEAERRTLGAKR